MFVSAGHAEAHGSVTLAGNHYCAHPIRALIAGVAGGRLKNRAGLHYRRSLAGSDSVQIIPTNAHARVGAARRTGVINTDVRTRP